MLGGYAPLPLRLVADSLQGLSAQQHARLSADLKATVRTVPFAVLTVNISGTTATITSYIGQNGVGLGAAPTTTSIGAAFFDIEWGVAFEDDYGNIGATNITRAEISMSSTVERYGVATVQNRRTVRVRPFDGGGSTTSADDFCLVVY